MLLTWDLPLLTFVLIAINFPLSISAAVFYKLGYVLSPFSFALWNG